MAVCLNGCNQKSKHFVEKENRFNAYICTACESTRLLHNHSHVLEKILFIEKKDKEKEMTLVHPYITSNRHIFLSCLIVVYTMAVAASAVVAAAIAGYNAPNGFRIQVEYYVYFLQCAVLSSSWTMSIRSSQTLEHARVFRYHEVWMYDKHKCGIHSIKKPSHTPSIINRTSTR